MREYAGRRARSVRNAVQLRLDLKEFAWTCDLGVRGRDFKPEGNLVEDAKE